MAVKRFSADNFVGVSSVLADKTRNFAAFEKFRSGLYGVGPWDDRGYSPRSAPYETAP